jgi:hypothetical protein
MLVALAVHVPQVEAADARFERVVVLPSRERVSVVFELTAEPADVSTRRVSAAVFELEAGPVAAPLTASTLVAPPGVRFVSSVAIQGVPEGKQGMLKARITLLERSRSSVRVVGRRVYVDFMAGAPPRQMPSDEPVRAERRQPADPAPAAAPPATVAPAAVAATAAYRAAVQPVWDRFEELRPFLLSASNAPSPPVLQAIGNTVTDIRQAARRVEVPAEASEAHRLLLSALDAAATAVDPAFGGDRKAQAQLALVLLDQAKQAV